MLRKRPERRRETSGEGVPREQGRGEQAWAKGAEDESGSKAQWTPV